ncbi:hypothetical protein F5X99DRAFT_75620 [Biscogniauxia marginata]|nr:hypothetical protein F5X99DRAFT_75620 [Biscogniauxia marginata]
MQFKAVALALLVTAVSADSVEELLTQIPSCAKSCLDNASTSIGCGTTDTWCQCDKKTDLTKAAIVCVQGACSSDDLKKTTTVSAELCLAVAQQSAGDAASSIVASATAAAGSGLASASNAITSAIGSATATPSTDAASGRNVAGMGIVGAAAMFAWAL